MTPTLNTTGKQMKELVKDVPDNQPLVMINFLKFKEKVENSELTGEEQYALYGKAFMPFVKTSGAKIIWSGKPMMYFIGNEDDTLWDKVLLVEYPSKQHFLDMISAPDYPHELRSAALFDSKLMVSLKES